MTQYGFFFDQSRCYGCQACSVACKDWNDIEPGPRKWMSVYEWEKGSFPNPSLFELAFSCGHCENPACIPACEHHAIFKEDAFGAVLVDADLCEGDRNCLDACPYGVPRFASDDRREKMSKCTMCIDRLEAGGIPECVASCPMRALDFGPIDELKEKYGTCQQLEDMPEPTTSPAWVARPRDARKQLVPLDYGKVIELSQPRGKLGMVYENVADLTPDDPDEIRRDELVMKNYTSAAVMAATTNNQG